MATMSRPSGGPTKLNLEVLSRHFASRDEISNQVEVASVPHILRCLRAGLIEVGAERDTLKLTEKGRQAIRN